MRWLARIVLLVLVAVAGIAASLAGLFYASLPQTTGTIRLTGLEASVTIDRDENGIPHVAAQSVHDAWFAVGFVHAQDRLWQMEMNRRIGAGRLSEILGKEGLGMDRFMRTLGLYRHAQASIDHLDPGIRRQLEAYAAGINAFLEWRRWPLPPEFQLLWHEPEPWTLADSLVWPRLMALDLSKNWRDEAMRSRLARRFDDAALADLMPGGGIDDPVSVRTVMKDAGSALDRVLALSAGYSTTGLGSNVFAVGSAGSASGAAMLASDPHLRLQTPSIWYLVSITAPGLTVAGATMPSMPFVVIGRNADIAWGFTNSGADVEDLVIETVDPGDPERYLTAEGSEPFRVIHENIRVRGGETVSLDVRESRNGPIISDVTSFADRPKGAAIALRWTGLSDDDVTIEAGARLATARNWREFLAALEDFQSPPQNAAFADRWGHVGITLAGRIPIRSSGDGKFPTSGTKADGAWTSFIPYSELPRIFDPPSAWVMNANNRFTTPRYPYHLTSDWDPALRARRLEDLLNRRPLSASDLVAAQDDIHSTLADDFLPLLFNIELQSPELVDLVERLRQWDRDMDRSRPEGLIFAAWYHELVRAILADELAGDFPAFDGIRPNTMYRIVHLSPQWCDDIGTTERVETCADSATVALERAYHSLTLRFGGNVDSWSWGAAQPVVMEHIPFSQIALIRRLFSIETTKSGDSSSPDVAHYRVNEPFTITAAASMRMLVDWSKPAQMRMISATGQSGHPLSGHHHDMTDFWRNGRLVTLDFPHTPSSKGRHLQLAISR